jgi:hypothetical protein
MKREIIGGTSAERQTKAAYIRATEYEGRCNPYLEALPDTDEIISLIKKAAYTPIISDEERNASRVKRASLISKISYFYYSFDEYVQIAIAIVDRLHLTGQIF